MKTEELQGLLAGFQASAPVLDELEQIFASSPVEQEDKGAKGWSKESNGGKHVSPTTKRRRHQQTLEGIRALKNLVTSTSEWMMQLHSTDAGRSELLNQLGSTAADLQVALERLAIVEKQRQSAVEELQAVQAGHHVSMAAGTGTAALQAALDKLQAECEAAKFCAAEAEAALASMTLEQAPKQAALEAADAAAERASKNTAKHQAAVAQLTGDNLVLMLRVRAAEEEAAAGRKEREELRAALDEQRGPWFDEVRAGVQSKIAAAMERNEALEAQLESMAASHAKQLAALKDRCSTLEEHLTQAKKAADDMSAQCSAAELEADRAAAQLKDFEASTKQDREIAVEKEAENRVLIATVRSMQDECYACKESQRAAEGKVEDLQAQIAQLEQQLANAKGQVAAVRLGVESQKDINEQLMARKQEMEWQLMAALANAPNTFKTQGHVSFTGDNGLHQNGSVAVSKND
ncbi:g1320 [Coccomyxa elongata]